MPPEEVQWVLSLETRIEIEQLLCHRNPPLMNGYWESSVSVNQLEVFRMEVVFHARPAEAHLHVAGTRN